MNVRSTPSMDMATLFDVVRYRASALSGTADSPAFTYLNDGDNVSHVVTFAQLDQAAQKLAARLQQVTRPGDRVLLVYPPSLDYIVAFYACVYAGVTAVPALPPTNKRTLPRLRLIAADAQPVAALTFARIRASVAEMEADDQDNDVLKQLAWLSTDDLEGDAPEWIVPTVHASDIVFLQYTSGSTGAPKGVMVAHHNLLANLRLFEASFDLRPGDVFVFWLPPHHDFGLIGSIIMPVYVGAHSVQFPPAAFLMRPYRWLRLISQYRARITGAPNFAYQLCVDKLTDAQKQELDLGCLDIAMNGAERIRFESVAQFSDTFAACGFRPETMTPCYGMAEFVLLTSANMQREAGVMPRARRISKAALESGRVVTTTDPLDAIDIVSTGKTREELHQIAVVDPVELTARADDQVGEVWLRGPSVTQGYWGQDESSREATFRATMTGSEHTWLRTGDVGFLSDGELYITGRIKEVMIFNGRNIYPQDVEITVEKTSPAFRANGCAAFSMEEGATTRLVIVQEVESRRRLNTDNLIAKLRAEIAEQHEILDLAAVLLVRPGHLPRTSSGKIQRIRCRQLYLSAAFDCIWSWNAADEALDAANFAVPQTPTETRLLQLWCALFDRAELSTADNFFRLGGHSLLAAQLIAGVRDAFRVELPLRALFEAPTVASLASTIDGAQPIDTPADEIVPTAHEGELPLSFAQQRFWFLDQYQPDNGFYAVPMAISLSGDVDIVVLQRALNAIVERHEALRTIFPSKEGVPRQVILPTLSLSLDVLDRADLDASHIEANIHSSMMEEAHQSFDLARGPLMRARLLRYGTGHHVLLITIHHIVYDGWSTGILLDEVARCYTAFKDGKTPALAELPLRYRDYALWERQRYDEQRIQEHLAYWREHLLDAPPLLALPTDRPRPAAMSHRGAIYPMRLPPELVERLTALAHERNATLFMVLTAAIQVLLHRYCNQDDLCLGVLSANRPAKTEGVIGAFVNVVPLRARLTAAQSFSDLLDAAVREVLSAYDRQLPFELVLSQIAGERNIAYTPYAQVVLNFHSELESQGRASAWQSEQALQFGGRSARSITHAAFDVLLEMSESQGGLDVVFEYNVDLFDESTIQRWSKHFQNLLAGIVESPQQTIDRLPSLDAAERRQVVETFNDTAQAWHDAPYIHQLFESQAARHPDATALVYEDERLSYGELNRRANRVAHALIGHGIGPDDRVAICMERSVAMVVGLLGILKAGAAYVPIDPGYPLERVAYMLADCEPRLLLSQASLRDELPGADVETLWLDESSTLSEQPDHNPDPDLQGLQPHHLAYVIYTSGSTGKPKGAMNQHDGVVNRLLWAQQQFALDANDRVLQKTPFGFDVSVWEFFLPLLAGAQLVLARPGGHQSPAYLAELMDSAGITVAHFVPSMLRVFLDQADLSCCKRMRHVLCSGEALPPSLQNRFLQRLPAVALHNLYGPTEAAVDVTHWSCQQPGHVVPIGRPIANTHIYVLDAHLQPVPIGVPGELYIGGVQVGRGYLNRAVLTDERFIANPFASGRLYKTGDMGRWRTDGAIEYLGRNDFQLKLRGFRIELGEIEARLLAHPAVREAAVIAREEISGDKRLVAYVVPQHQPASDGDERDVSHVDAWRKLYQAEYGKALDIPFGEDFRSWNSSYDGEPIPLEEMREWRAATVTRILELKPRRLLEIGTGSGLILSQVAPHCEAYWGTDLSEEAVEKLKAQVMLREDLAERVKLHCQAAHIGDNLPKQAFDVIVINSVAQCFPSAAYMLSVLRLAIDLLSPDGALFLGDIRNLPLLHCLAVATQLAKADNATDPVALKLAIDQQLKLEQELIFDPAFFSALPHIIDGIAGVDIRIKRGRFSNELSRYRYDVVLRKVPTKTTSLATLPRMHWGSDVADMDALSVHLQAASFNGLRLCHVPNQHLANEVTAVQAFERGQSLDAVLSEFHRSPSLLHPEDMHALGASLGLQVIVTWADQRGAEIQDGAIDVLFLRVTDHAFTDTYEAVNDKRQLIQLTSEPTHLEEVNRLVGDLREELSSQLPDYMVPAAFVVLDSLPLTPNGKLDRQALPAPDRDAVVTRQYEAPQGEVEETIAAIWQELLGLALIGRHDHFFELGGHSLLATQVASKLRDAMRVDIALKALFEHPTLTGLAQHVQIEAYRPSADIDFDIPLIKSDPQPFAPASLAQQRLWFIEQVNHGQPVYNMTYAVRLRGELDRHALQQSLLDIAGRHEALRTCFIDAHGKPMRQVLEAPTLSLHVVDLSAQQDGAVQAWIDDEARRPFDLQTAPLIRVTLLQLQPTQNVLLICAHHIIADGWSLGVFNRELTACYNARLHRAPSPLPELPFQYSDFAHWQQQRLQGGALEPQLLYWQKQLSDAPAVLSLPTDRPRSATPSHRGAIYRFVVPKSLTAELKKRLQQSQATLFMGLASALGLMLSRYAGQSDLCIGTPIANRHHASLEDIIGFFVNILVLRIQVDGSQNVDALLQQVRDVALDAYANQDVPFDQLVAALDRSRHDKHSPLFQVMLVLQNAPVDDLAFEHVTPQLIPVDNGTAKFDLTLTVTEVAEALACEFEYSTDLLDRTTVERMARHFETILRGIAADAQTPLDRLPLLDDAERKQVLETFNASAQVYPSEGLIHQRFEAQAQLQPDAMALVYEGESLTYAQLNAQANQVAHALIAQGVRPDDRVALCAERSLALVVGLLGILKAGGGYVPLDPAYPAERLTYMLEDSAPVVLLTASSLQEQLPAMTIPRLLLDDSDALALQPTHDPALADLTSKHLAYVIYTSGSTGKPKGVMVEHAQVVRLLTATDDDFHFGAEDVWTLFHSYAFDFSVWELWGALAYGGRLVIVPSLCARSPKDFYALLCKERVTVLNQTPSAFRALINAQDEQVHRLRYVIFGGEALELHTLAPWVERNDPQQTRLINMYGITETTVHVTYRQITRADIEAGRGSVIGRGLSDLRIYILDTHSEPVPIGVPGELYIGGAGVTRGYLRRPELTAERFLRDPFQANPTARMYKSGDLGKWLPDGTIEYLGRNDFQVKIRGFRIELGEIEAKLAASVGIRDAVVIAREDVPGDKRLVAYITTHEDASLSVNELRSELSKQLAEYMVPSAFVQLERLPLTTNGKLDRQALPMPDHEAVATRTYEAPQSEIEATIVAIWQALLGLQQMGRHDHFFELGGHSLLAAQMMASVRTACQVELPLGLLFDAPTVTSLAAAVAQAKPQTSATFGEIVPASHGDNTPLSFAQQRFWFLDQYQLDNTFYTVSLVIYLTGVLDISALERALNTVIERHKPLRTIFPEETGVPHQMVLPSVHLSLQLSYVEDGNAQDATTHVRKVMADEVSQPFDLTQGPLIRARLLRRASENHVLMLTTHHIVYDGWSTRILLDELTRCYLAFKEQKTSPLAALPIDYADYTLWEQQRYVEQHIGAELAYWKAHLQDAPPLLVLPTDRPRPALMTHHGASHRMQLPGDLIERLTVLANQRNATLFMVLTAAMNVLLHRYGGQKDICIGVMSASRPSQTDGLIGNFINILPLCVSIEETPHFLDMIDTTAKNLLAAYDRELPFELILRHVLRERSSAYIPYAQVVLNFHSEFELLSQEAPQSDALTWHLQANEARQITHAAFDLKVEMNQLKDGLDLVYEYNTDLFDEATIARWSEHYQTLLEAACAEPLTSIHQLDTLTASERRAFAEQWATAQAPYPHDATIAELFDAQVARTPDALAVVHRDHALSYRELSRRTDQWAHLLRSEGVGPDVLVGIYAERSIEMVVAVLAVVKAGGAYIPLDPAYPQARLDHMLSDARPHLVLTQARLAARLQGLGQRVLCVDTMESKLAAYESVALPPMGAPSHLAYVIYTSGSTGRPKGAMVHRQGFMNLLHWYIRQFDIRADDKVLLLSSFSFDLTQKNIFAVLLVGGQLHLPADDDVLGGASSYIAHHGITYLNCAPSAFYPLLADDGVERLSSLRQVFLGGEPIRVALIHDAYRDLPKVPYIHNTYGPTEASDVVSFHTWDPRIPATSLPIGRAIANTRLYVLDAHRQLVPSGTVGELYIGGDGVGRGYLNLPELTEECFLPDPYTDVPGRRMYKTGDVVRQLADGSLEYLGRNDFQVKIRGFRIELGEIEAKLATCEGVREAVVIAREDVPGDKRLVAYFTAQESGDVSVAALRRALSTELAEYMLPSAFVQLQSLPLTPNGKLDRQALPAPDQGAVATHAYEAPQGQTEATIAAIWQELLGLQRVGRQDHFFELGGHSLLAVQLIARLRKRCGAEVALRDLFAQPTLQGLAQTVAHAARAELSAIRIADRSRPLPLSWSQQRLWFIDQLDPSAGVAYHMPAGLRMRGQLDCAALQATLDRIVARHEILRTRFVSVDGQPVQVIAAAQTFDLSLHDLRAQPHSEQLARQLAVEEARAPFDLSTGPLLRGRLLQLADDDHILLLTQHHTVSDGWSIDVLVREVSALYTAFSQAQPDPLPPLPLQYADYAAWQRNELQREAMQDHAAYWTQHLSGAPHLLTLPTDRPRPAVQSYIGDHVNWVIDPVVSTGLRQLSQYHGTTLFMTALSAWSIVLSRWSGQTDVVIGTPIAHRQRSELEPLIGFFVNTLALRVQLNDAPTVETLLARTRQQLLDAYTHQDLPFEQVVETLQPPRSLSHSPVFQVMLVMNNTPGGVLSLPGLELQVLEPERNTAHFDLTLSLREDGERIEGSLSYASDLFDRATIERMARHFETVLRGMVADAQTPIDRLPLLDDAERQQVLETFNASTQVYSSEGLIHQRFEAQVQAQPDAVALVYEGESLTYAQLNAQANRVAHTLIAQGVRPDDRVALCSERSLALVVGLLGILKAGGGYVPLDPAYPAERLAYMLEDSAPVVLLTASTLQAQLPETTIPRLLLDDPATLASHPTHNPVVDGLAANHLAYVIYTSGSTGKPKGVMVEHAQVVRLLAATHDDFHFGPDDVWTLFHSYAFDFSVWELWGALAYGGRLVIVPSLCARSPKDFYALLCKEQVTVLNQTPSAFRVLINAQDEQVHRLRYVIFGGEALELHTLVPWIERNDPQQTRLINMYGITEITVHATYRAITREDIESGRGSVVGRGLPDLRVYILDHHGEPAPVGVSGEIYIAGAGVARGYLNRPALTAERFLRDPFQADPTARIYKSGDLGKWLPDGTIEYLGRNDFQVKIRGFRIELGEIEAKLAQQPGVRDAVVIAREDVPGDKRLVAYLTTQQGSSVVAAELRSTLSKELADYMVPSAFVQLTQLPLTPNGKLDRQALPPPDQHAVAARDYEAPQGEVEQMIAAIWQELLGLQRVGRHDNFFELGGHSLLAVQLVARLRHACRVDVPLAALFHKPQLDVLAGFVLSLQVETFLGDDLETIQQELDAMSEEELLAILEKDAIRE